MAAPSFLVELVDRCDIVERGERLQVWFVRHNAHWVRAAEHPSVRTAMKDDAADTIPPGTVWVRRTELELPRGTLLRRIISRPRVSQHFSASDYLKREIRSVRRARQEYYYRVTGSYCMSALRPTRARSASHEDESTPAGGKLSA